MNFYGFEIKGLGMNVLATGAFLLFLIVAAIATIVLLFHWKRYGFKMRGIVLAELTYLTGLAVLLSGAFFELSFLI